MLTKNYISTYFRCRIFFADDDNTEDGHKKRENGDNEAGPLSLPFVGRTSYFQRFSQTRLSNREQSTTGKNKSKSVSYKPSPSAISPAPPIVDPNIGPERQLCQDCKEMVLQVVRAQSTARRLQFAKSLFQLTLYYSFS